MAYTTKAKIEAYLGESISASESQVNEWIAGVTKFIDKYTGRKFEADSVASDRLFNGKRSDTLIIDDCISVSNVYQGDTYGSSFTEKTDYIKNPLNSLPFTSIKLKECWGIGIHKVKAKWGYSITCPEDITLASTILCAGIINADVSQETKSESIGDYSVTYKDESQKKDYITALGILDAYKRYFI